MKKNEVGYTLVELMAVIVVVSIISLSALGLMATLLSSAILTQHDAVAQTLANDQMEYLKSLPYDNLAIAGGPIISNSTIPASFTKKVEGVTYTVTTNINYIDDAYNGCGPYPNQTLKAQYCRNYPPPSGAPDPGNTDDYKDINVKVTDKTGKSLTILDSQVASLVAETASNTGAFFIRIVDDSGNPISGAAVGVINNSVSPNVNASDISDQNGVVIFYNLPISSSGYKYVISASKSNYSSLTTISPNGSLQPTYSSQNLIAQTSSYVTLTLKPMGTYSLVIAATDTSGNPLTNAKIYVKGGYKKYTINSDTSYYYDTLSPSDIRPITDTNGLASLSNLVPGDYYLCGDSGSTSCSIGGTTYYLAAAVPYGGSNPIQPIIVPDYQASNPPATTFLYNGNNFLQKVRLILTTNSNFPRVVSLAPYDASISSGTLNNFAFSLTGINLPCNSIASSCSTHVSFLQGANTYTASCTGNNSGLNLNCTVNIASASVGNTQLVITVGSNTLTLPASPLLGGIIVTN